MKNKCENDSVGNKGETKEIKLSTQLAVLIYITDHLDEQKPLGKPLIQNNVLYICGCSVCALHRAKNTLGI